MFDKIGLTDIFFVDFAKGWVVGEGGMVVYTDDAGKTWTKPSITNDWYPPPAFWPSLVIPIVLIVRGIRTYRRHISAASQRVG
jgi:photosystem II stability/assembly factor-like uncharacterized protein